MSKKALLVTRVSGFVPQFEMNNVKILQEMGYEIHYAANFDVVVYGKDNSRLMGTGIHRHHIPFGRSPFSRDVRTCYLALKKLMLEEKFDLIHCHMPMTGVLTRKAAEKVYKMTGRKVPVIYTAHGFHFFQGAPLWNWLLFYPVEKYYARKTDVLITINSEDYDRAVRKMHAKQVVRIPGVGLKPGKYRFASRSREEVREALDLPLDAILLISVGELNRNKNHRVIIQAMARLPQLPLYYILCGKGKEAEFLQELAQSLHLSNRVRILGYRQDVCDLLHASDIFCFPSKREGLGMAALEAMEAGLPLVTSNIHGIRDYSLSGETGFACPVSNVEEFAHAIETLSENRNLRKRMGTYNQQAVEAFYQAKTDEIMKSVYTDVLKLDEILPETEPEPVESASSSRT